VRRKTRKGAIFSSGVNIPHGASNRPRKNAAMEKWIFFWAGQAPRAARAHEVRDNSGAGITAAERDLPSSLRGVHEIVDRSIL